MSLIREYQNEDQEDIQRCIIELQNFERILPYEIALQKRFPED